MAKIEHKLAVETRNSFGKGAARKIRAAGQIPAVLYGHGTEPQHVNLPGHETMLLLRQANALVQLTVDGTATPQLVLVKDVQRDPVRRIIEHVDFVIIRKGERVEVEVAVHLTGEPAPGLQALQDATSLLVSADATQIPEFIELSIEGAEDGVVVLATEIDMPEGVELVDPEAEVVIVTVAQPRVTEEPEDEAEDSAEGAAEASAAE